MQLVLDPPPVDYNIRGEFHLLTLLIKFNLFLVLLTQCCSIKDTFSQVVFSKFQEKYVS